MAKQESRSPTSSPSFDSIQKASSSGSQVNFHSALLVGGSGLTCRVYQGAQKGSSDGPRGYNVATRRFLSLCMEDIEPVMEMRGKDAMYQCCYCGKWCSMSGTRALSKHIENEHRPQVIVQIQGFLASLDIKLQPSKSKIVFIGFLPLDHWNVHLEAAIHCSQGSQQWASLLPIHEVREGTETATGRQSLHLKMTSAKPYLPRPTWSDSEHARQRVGVRISESLENLSKNVGGADRTPSGFAIKVEAPANALKEPLEAEISLSLKVHGKEAAIVLPLTISTGFQHSQEVFLSPSVSNIVDHVQWGGGGVKRESVEDPESPTKRAKVQAASEASGTSGTSGASGASGMAQLSLVAAQQQAMVQHLQLAHQAMAMRAMSQVHPLLYVNPQPMQGLGDMGGMDTSSNVLRPVPQNQLYGMFGNVSVSDARMQQDMSAGGLMPPSSLGGPGPSQQDAAGLGRGASIR